MLFPDSVGKYEIVRKKLLGRGSFSRVYLGQNQSETVAIKILSLTEIGNLQHRLKYEIEVMKTLKHDHIVNMKDVIYKDDFVFLILDYCQNGDLHKFLNGRPLKEKYARFYLNQMANGLKYLYEKQIIHRDLKPQNLLLSDDYTLKITDFGFAKYFDQTGMSETICGTPLYMAPEIMKFKKYSIKSDLWSVGVILYEMLVGRTPYKARNHMELLHKINTQAVIVPFSLEISEGGKNLITKLLQKNPKDRINWNQFFNHPWLLDEMRVSIFSGGSLKEPSVIRNLKQFNSKNDEFFKNDDEFFKYSKTELKKPLLKIIDDYSDTKTDESFYSCDEDTENNNKTKTAPKTAPPSDDFQAPFDDTPADDTPVDESYSNESSISFSDGDEDIILPDKTNSPSLRNAPPRSEPISILTTKDDIGVRYSNGRVLANSQPKNDQKDLFLPIVDMTPRKDSGFVIVNSPKEYDIISDILTNENRKLSESLLDYMGDTYNYLRSFVKKNTHHRHS